ncbi:MAG: HD domain-containing protein [Promethearchaeota archaeon]
MWKAITYAFINYGDLKRKSNEIPYIVHPIRVVIILRAAGYSDSKNENLMIAALLHDLLEDTKLTFEDLKLQFGVQVALVVKELSKPEDSNKDEWLRSFGTVSKEAKIIKIADRIDNLLDMNSIGWTEEKHKMYAKQSLIILDKCGKANVKLANKLKDVIEQSLSSL